MLEYKINKFPDINIGSMVKIKDELLYKFSNHGSFNNIFIVKKLYYYLNDNSIIFIVSKDVNPIYGYVSINDIDLIKPEFICLI